MTAKIIDGRKFSEEILSQLKKRVEKLRSAGIVPKLDIILVGDDEASQIYVGKKMLSSKAIGMRAELHRLPAKTEKGEIKALGTGLRAILGTRKPRLGEGQGVR